MPEITAVIRSRGWPRSRGFLCTILRAMQSGTKVSVRYRRSGRLSGVVVKRGSTVCINVLVRT